MASTRHRAQRPHKKLLHPFLIAGWFLLALSLAAPAQEGSERRWLGPDGQPLPFASDEEALAFLRSAEVLSMQQIPEGVTRPRKLLLEADGVQAHAVFRVVDESLGQARLSDGSVRASLNDSAIRELAAYEMARLLGLHTIPPTVERTIGRDKGTLQLWIENALTESARLSDRLQPTDIVRFSREIQTMRVFDALVGNDDRNTGNVLYEADTWTLWMIDHTRSFQITRGDLDLEGVDWCERGLWERLQTLQREEVDERLKEYVSVFEIDSLFERRDQLVNFIQNLIDVRGEDVVLY